MMSETDIQALYSLVKELQTKLAQRAAAGGVVVATAAASQPVIKVNVPREQKLQKYSGARDDKILEDWIDNTARVNEGSSGHGCCRLPGIQP